MKSNILEEEFIILEIIPTSLLPENGQLIQLSALKVKNYNVIDRFDYRLKEDNILIKKLIDIINYDKNDFIYKENENQIWNDFIKWSNNLPILYIDNSYTYNYIEHLSNKKEPILNYLDLKYSDDIIEILLNKYNIEPTNYIVDILLEALIYHSNEKETK